MITLMLLNNRPITLNALQIESIESTPDTQIVMVNGRRFFVTASVDEVRTAIDTWFASLLARRVGA